MKSVVMLAKSMKQLAKITVRLLLWRLGSRACPGEPVIVAIWPQTTCWDLMWHVHHFHGSHVTTRSNPQDTVLELGISRMTRWSVQRVSLLSFGDVEKYRHNALKFIQCEGVAEDLTLIEIETSVQYEWLSYWLAADCIRWKGHALVEKFQMELSASPKSFILTLTTKSPSANMYNVQL